MNKLNRSLPNMRPIKQEQIKEELDSDSDLNSSFDLRRYLAGKSGKSPERRARKLREKSESRKVYLLKRKHNDNDTSMYKRSRSDSVSVTAPLYQHYQLLGDSQFVRFSEQLLNYDDMVTYTEDTASKRIGYCVSGQKIKDLMERIESEELPIYPYVIMLIGTNDIVHNTDLHEMCENYNKILQMLKKKCRRIILLTVPPVPRFEKRGRHWFILKSFNNFVQNAADGTQLFTLDLCSVFISYNNTISRDYYESYYKGSLRPDLIHLNRKGFLLLRTVLDIFFETYEKNEH